jgi:hypothetical protein
MPVSAEQFRDALSKLDNGEELLEFHTLQVLAEKNKGIEISRSKNHEAQNLRAYKKALEKLGFDPVEGVLDEFTDGIIAKMENDGVQETGKLSDLQKTIAKLQKDFEKTQKELGTEREQKTALQQQNKIKTIESKLLPKLQDEFYGANFIVKALLADGSVDLDEAGEVVFKKGDQVLSLADGLKGISESNADARKNKQNGGAGSSASVQPNRPKFTLEQIKSMNPEQMKANITEVNESMRALNTAK